MTDITGDTSTSTRITVAGIVTNELDALGDYNLGYIGANYFDADAFGTLAGNTPLSVQSSSTASVATLDQIAGQLVNGFWSGDSHHFNVTQGGTITVNFGTLTVAEQNLARAALQQWSDIIGINFQQVTIGGQILFDNSEDGSGNPVAATDAAWSNGITSSAHVQISSSWVQTYGTSLNSYSFQTYVHEIGHALGLGHPGDYNSTATYSDDAKFLNDAWSTSVMSYFDQHENFWFANQGFSRDFAVTPMGADILAMQTLYGLSTTTRIGDTTYGYGSNAGGIYDAALYPHVALTIFDNGGTDTLNFSGSPANQTINLNAETFSNVNGDTGNLYVARGVVIENAIAGSGNDTIIQNAAGNVLDGGAGNDTISYETAAAGVSVNLGLTTAQDTGGAGIDTLGGFENLIGSAYGDTLVGGAATVSISGGAGDDLIDAGLANPTGRLTLSGGDGDDTFLLGVGAGPFVVDGGSGYNILDGSHASGGLLLSTSQIAPGGINSLLNIQKIIGSNFDDNLTARFAGDVLIGGAGNDTLTGYGGTQLSGGTGNDTYYVSSTTDQIVENPGDGTDTVNAACDYTLGSNLENLTLHEFLPWDPYGGTTVTPPPPENFTGTGNDRANVIIGNLGTNVLTGAGGDDTFQNSVAGFNGDTITDFSAGDRIIFSDATLGSFSFSINGNVLNYSGGSLTLGSIPPGRIVASAAAGGGVQIAVQPDDARNDFNGDGRSDILWRDDTGQFTDWLGSATGGFTPNSANAYARVPTSWHIAGSGDFNGDGRDDILWRNDDGTVTDWLANASGGFAPSTTFSMQVATAWHIAGTGDFNGDGKDDILWRNDSGQLTNWLATGNGGFTASTVFSTYVPTDWHVVATGDFNGDGKDDILWRNDTGQLTDWFGSADGSLSASSSFSTYVPTDWQVVGTGDFNGDGYDDILWRNGSGQMTDWLGDSTGGFTQNGANASTYVATSWHIAQVGDFNGDGKDDILWRDDSGHTTNWLGTASGGFTPNSANFSTTVDTSWHIEHPLL